MPKKTKKEKIIAQYRRKLGTIRETVPAPTTPTFVYQAATPSTPQVALSVQPVDRAIRRDLVKTLLLAAMAIAGEVVLSMVVK